MTFNACLRDFSPRFGEPGEVEYSGEIVGESAIRFEDQIGLNITHVYEVCIL